jgi:hypothetical protein
MQEEKSRALIAPSAHSFAWSRDGSRVLPLWKLVSDLFQPRCATRGIFHDTDEDGEEETFTRQWVIWHLIEHDVHHGGEISFALGMHGLAAINL